MTLIGFRTLINISQSGAPKHHYASVSSERSLHTLTSLALHRERNIEVSKQYRYQSLYPGRYWLHLTQHDRVPDRRTS